MDSIISYFNGEKFQCLIGAVGSVLCIALSVYSLFLQKPILKGLAFTVIPIAILLLAVCIGVIARTPKDIKRVTTYYQETPEKIKTEELPRMEKVINSFSILKKVEIALFLIGLVGVVLFWRNEMIRGISLGLIIMACALYSFDHIAQTRGKGYVQYLNSLS